MTTNIDLATYLRRIAWRGMPASDVATLQSLAQHHAASIPFENLDPLLGRPVPLDLPSLERKLLHDGRGGYCFEHNLLFAAALEQIGFSVTRLAARVLWGRPEGTVSPRSHMLLRVDLPDGPWIADVGFGGLTLTGALRLQADIEQPTPHEPFRLVATEDGFLMQANVRDDWMSLYRFDLHPHLPIDYEAPNWYLSTHPASRFVGHLLCARAAPDRRYALLDRELAVHHRDGRTERRVLRDAGEMREVLERDFLIRLPDDAGLDAKLAALPHP